MAETLCIAPGSIEHYPQPLQVIKQKELDAAMAFGLSNPRRNSALYASRTVPRRTSSASHVRPPLSTVAEAPAASTADVAAPRSPSEAVHPGSLNSENFGKQLKVRKRRENRSTEAGSSGTQSTLESSSSSQCETDPSGSTKLPFPDAAGEPPGFDDLQLSPGSETRENPRPASEEPERRQSIKRKVLARVLSNVPGRAKSGPQLRNGQSDGSLLRRLSARSDTDEKRSKSMETLKSPAQSPSQTATPPASNKKRRHRSSFLNRKPLPSTPAPCERPPPPNIRPVLSVDVQLTPEVTTIPVSAQKSVWVAVELTVNADIPRPAISNELVYLGLDIIIIVDNSKSVSSDSLRRASRLVSHLVDLLDHLHDRVAVFCTCCRCLTPASRNHAGCQLHALSIPCLHVVEEELRNVEMLHSSSPSGGGNLRETLRATANLLAEQEDTWLQTLRSDRTQFFVLSPNVADFLELTKAFSHLQVHFICTSAVPSAPGRSAGRSWQASTDLGCNGWVASKRADLEKQRNLLSKVIELARAGIHLEAVRDVRVNLHPVKPSKLEMIWGSLSYPTLMPGETVLLFAQVGVDAIPWTHPRKQSLVQLDEARSESSPKSLREAFQDLEVLLGEHLTELIAVEVQYKHPCVQGNGDIIHMEACRLARPNPASTWSVGSTNEQPSVDIQRLQAFFIATSETPDASIAALDAFVGAKKHKLYCLDYVNELKAELLHQRRTVDDTVRTQVRKRSSSLGVLPCLARGSSGDRSSQLSLQAESVPGSNVDSPVTVIHHPSPDRKEYEESTDQARAIWRHLRKDSKSKWKLAEDPMESIQKLEAESEHIKEIRRKAVQNKRSVGADTLRSLALSTQAAINGGMAPWL